MTELSCQCICNETAKVAFTTTEKVIGKVPLSSSEKLQIMLVILVILLVIIGLIIGFKKLREDYNEEDKDGETYY